MPLLLLRTKGHIPGVYRQPSIGIQNTSTSVQFESDSKTHNTSSVCTLTRIAGTAEGPAIVTALYDEAFILGSKAII